MRRTNFVCKMFIKHTPFGFSLGFIFIASILMAKKKLQMEYYSFFN